MLRLLMPIIKLGPCKYLIGSKIRQIIIKNNHLIARVGGGFMELEQCIAIEAKTECLQISMQMERKGQTFQEAMVDILTAKKASKEVISKFIKDTNRVQIPFGKIMLAVKQRESTAWARRKVETKRTSFISEGAEGGSEANMSPTSKRSKVKQSARSVSPLQVGKRFSQIRNHVNVELGDTNYKKVSRVIEAARSGSRSSTPNRSPNRSNAPKVAKN